MSIIQNFLQIPKIPKSQFNFQSQILILFKLSIIKNKLIDKSPTTIEQELEEFK